MKNKTIPIIIVTYNKVKEFTIPCIESIVNNTSISYELIIVDNNSSDNTVSILKNKYPSINIISNGCNDGWAGGNIIGIEYAKKHFRFDYICFLNSDTIVSKNWIKKLHSILEKDDKAVSASPTEIVIKKNFIINFYNKFISKNKFILKIVKWYPLCLVSGKGFMTQHAVTVNSIDKNVESISLAEKVNSVNFLLENKFKNKISGHLYITTGYCLLLKKSILSEFISFLKDFDTLFPSNAKFYWEEIFRKRNVKHYVSKDTYVYHFRGGSGGY